RTAAAISANISTTPNGKRRRMPRLYRGGGALVAEERLERRHVERLAEYGVDVAGRGRRVLPARHQRQLEARRQLPQSARQLQPVHLRHGEVEERGVEGAGRRQLQRLA